MLRKLLDRPIAVTMTAIVLVILGIVSCRLLPISLVPDVDAPYITIQIPAQGISARQLNETVITPLRQAAHPAFPFDGPAQRSRGRATASSV